MITLYTVDCPRCKMLENRLNKANIEYDVCKDTERMLDMGMNDVPVLEVDGKLLNYKEATEWIESKGSV